MQCALHLAGTNAYLKRSAARLYLHLEKPDRALSLVRSSAGTRLDPRLLATEIALSESGAGRSNWARAAAKVLSDANYRPRFVSDLSAALATVEMSHGKHKNARRLFASSLVAPSENSLAQAQWASERDKQITIPIEAWQTPFPHEARALAARVRCDWDAVLDASEHWLADEPYSMRPAAVGSFASFSIEQHHRSERLASAGIESNPDNAHLLNNRAVARAYLGDLNGTYSDLERAFRARKENDPVLIATLGLLAYRAGEPDVGARCYSTAVAAFIADHNKMSAALALLYWLREQIHIGAPTAATDLNFLKNNLLRITGGTPQPELTSMIASVEEQLAGTSQTLLFQDPVERSVLDLDYLLVNLPPIEADASPRVNFQRSL
jgi:hypothetical protein